MAKLRYYIITPDGEIRNRAATFRHAMVLGARWYPHSVVWDSETDEFFRAHRSTTNRDAIKVKSLAEGMAEREIGNMIQFPAGQNTMLVIIEPGNIRRLKEGRPLVIKLPNGSEACVLFTPDYFAFLAELGMDESQVTVHPKEKKLISVQLSAQKIDAALQKCRTLPEVER